MRLNIITPLSRPENLMAMWDSITPGFTQTTWVHWWIVQDPIGQLSKAPFPVDAIASSTIIRAEKPALAGHAHRNTALRCITDPNEWVMSLDDDNIIHPDFFPWLEANQNELSWHSGVIFDQVYKSGPLRLQADPENVCVNNVDTAQFMFRRGIIEDLRFKEDEYAADGLFIQDLYARHKDKFLIINEPLCYYNYLR